MLFHRPKKSPRTCPQGHAQEPTWDQCPFCTAEDLPKEPRAEAGPATVAATKAAEPGRGAVVVSKKNRAPAARRVLAGWLVAISGEHEGEDFRVHVGRNVLGKGAQADIVIKDAYASERHATVESKAGTCTVTDLDSKNGTFVNGRRISAPAEVGDGDRISLGHTELKYRSFE